MDGDDEFVFDPWYDYFSTAELVLRLGLGVVALATLWTGVADPTTSLGASAGLALLFGGFVVFFVRWSVSEERTAALPTFDKDY